MQSFDRKEIEWAAKALAEDADRLERIGAMGAATDAERELCLLRAEQYRSIAERLAAAAANGDRRIAIR